MNNHSNGKMVNDLDKREIHFPLSLVDNDVRCTDVLVDGDGLVHNHVQPDELRKLNDGVCELHVSPGEGLPVDSEWKEEVEVTYKVDETPPFGLCLLLAFQHYISMFIATLTIPILLAPAICMDQDNVGKSEITGTLFVASGIITLIQTTVGIRLPIVQAGTFALLVPTLSYFNLPQWKCPDNIVPSGTLGNQSLAMSNETYIEVGSPEHKEIWMSRLREIQGSIMFAALFEIFLGASGIVGKLLKYIGPLSICPTVTLLGLSLFKSAAVMAAKQWWICIATVLLMMLFSQYLGHFNIPCGFFSRSRGCQKQAFPIFKMFPIILSIIIVWLVCLILTETDVLPATPGQWGYEARTDLRTDAIFTSPWFRIPYPGQWGVPTVSLSAVCAILSGIIATTVESVGDYHACAKLAGSPPPPLHAVNRGILIEGIGTFFDGLMGTGNGTTSTSINVAVIGITKVGSRRVIQVSAVFMVAFGIFTKFGALFITIPDPIIGGAFFILFGMIVAVGISSLQHVDMNSGRNLFIIGFSLFTGLALPQWMIANPTAIQTGNQTLDSVCTVLLSTGMFVGGLIGFVLDNTLRGTIEERGLLYWKKMRATVDGPNTSQYLKERISATYDLPYLGNILQKAQFLRHLPFCQTYTSSRKTNFFSWSRSNCKCYSSNRNSAKENGLNANDP